MKMEIGGELVEVEPPFFSRKEMYEAIITGIIIGFVLGVLTGYFIFE